MTASRFLIPVLPAPARVKAASSLRAGGVSVGPYASLNLGDHVGDAPDKVQANREQLAQQLNLPCQPAWLNQVHGTTVVDAAQVVGKVDADASVCFGPGAVSLVMTADCLPVLLCDQQGTVVAAAHAGWRGLAAGVLEATIAKMNLPPQRLMAWLGPAIGPRAFEVGDEVRAAFISHDEQAMQAFNFHGEGHWLADIYLLARQRLQACGVSHISGGDFCTYSDPERFFSYRRDGVCGRMASLIWIAD